MKLLKTCITMVIILVGIFIIVFYVSDNGIRAVQTQLQNYLNISDSTEQKENVQNSNSPQKNRYEHNSSQTTKDEQTQKQTNKDNKVLLIGDSVMLGAYQELVDSFNQEATVDAKESRQITALPDILKTHADLSSYQQVVIGLGTNGVITDEAVEQAMALLKDKKVYWINIKAPIDWQDSMNATISELPNKYSNLTIIDWYNDSKDHPEYFYEDQIHLNGVGREAYAKYIASIV